MWWELSRFVDDVEKIESFLFDVAAHDEELQAFGLRYLLGKLDFERSREAFDSFSGKLNNCLKVASIDNRSIYNRLESLLEESKLEDLISQLGVRIKIAERERPSPLVNGVATYAYIFRRLLKKTASTSLFNDKTIPLESVLASLARLRTLIEELQNEHYRKMSSDDEIFKPSNVNVNIIAAQIESAIEDVTNSVLNESEKTRLVSYLNEAKSELAEESPAWKKVIGALVICSTLLGGIAVAPQAVDNINSAIRGILGSSVEKNIPNLLPAPKLDNNLSPQDDSDGDDSETLLA